MPTFPAGRGSPRTVCPLRCYRYCVSSTSTNNKGWAGLSLEDTPHLKAWFDKILARPGIEKGRHVPSRHSALDPATEADLEKRAAIGRTWVQKGMAEDAEKLKK